MSRPNITHGFLVCFYTERIVALIKQCWSAHQTGLVSSGLAVEMHNIIRWIRNFTDILLPSCPVLVYLLYHFVIYVEEWRRRSAQWSGQIFYVFLSVLCRHTSSRARCYHWDGCYVVSEQCCLCAMNWVQCRSADLTPIRRWKVSCWSLYHSMRKMKQQPWELFRY